MSESQRPIPERTAYSEADFERLHWHDAAVHAFALEPAYPYAGRLLVDLDYILEWVKPEPPESAFAFWLVPATLVFDHARSVALDLDLRQSSFELALNDVRRAPNDASGRPDWTLDGHNFTLSVSAPGFRLLFRSAPVWATGQRLTLDERGGPSFSETSYVP